MRHPAPPHPSAESALEAHARFLTTTYFGAFDGLRCVAVAGVVWHHCLPRPMPGWAGRGHVGVPLFFALSGFLITTLLLAERRSTGDIALGAFWMRRCLRIFPLYYLVLAGFVAALALRAPSDATRHFFGALPFHASFTANWFVDYAVPHPVWFAFGWSLATEEQFYVFWPPLLRGALRSGTAAAVLLLLGLVGLGQAAQCEPLETWVAQGSAARRMISSLAPALAFGSALALLLADRRSFRWLFPLLGARGSAPICAATLALLLSFPRVPFALSELLLASLVASCALGTSWFTRALAARPALAIGRVSYGIYLLHVPVLGACRRLFPALAQHPSALFPLTLCASFALARLSHRFLEAPCARLRARFRPGRREHQDASLYACSCVNVVPPR
jgi:peptidoglycan/LPS O-acetylase OafA/YrhL